MRLIGLALIVAVSLVLAPPAVEGQAGKVYRIGYLSPSTPTANAGLRKAFTDGLRDHRWIEGKNITVEYRMGGNGGNHT